MSAEPTEQDVQNGFEERLRQRKAELENHPLSTVPKTRETRPGSKLPNTPLTASTISFILGWAFSLGVLTFLRGGFGSWWNSYQLGFFVAAWSGFHWGEFAVTAGWNLEKCSIDSFLLTNGSVYLVVNALAVTEHEIVMFFRPSWKTNPYVTQIGIIIVLVGQAVRSMAMIQASTNFSHIVAHHKVVGHRLVKEGVYAWFRHPSYTGFFYWAIGTQMVLQNHLCFAIFLVLLWRFFYYRIRYEENRLINFFGEEYREYRKKTHTLIPFIP